MYQPYYPSQQSYQQQPYNGGATQNMVGRLNYLENNMNNNYGNGFRNMFKVYPVTNFDEAKSAMIDFDGSLNIFVDAQHNCIYTKQLDNNGLANLRVFKLFEEPEKVEPQFASKKDLDEILDYVQKLEEKVDSLTGGNKNERNASNAQSVKKQS